MSLVTCYTAAVSITFATGGISNANSAADRNRFNSHIIGGLALSQPGSEAEYDTETIRYVTLENSQTVWFLG